MTPLRTWLTRHVGATVTQLALAQAVDASESTIKRRERNGEQYSAEEVIAACRRWNLNPATALVDLGFLDAEEVLTALDTESTPVGDLSDYDLALELANRVKPMDAPLLSADQVMKKGEVVRPAHWGQHVPYPQDDYDLAASDQPDDDEPVEFP